MDYEAGEGTLGKPGGADLKLGLTTGPALYAWEEHPEMGPLIQRKFKNAGDVEMVSFNLSVYHITPTNDFSRRETMYDDLQA